MLCVDLLTHLHICECKGLYAYMQRCVYANPACKSQTCYLETHALLLGFLCFGGAGGGAVQGTAAASCRTELAAFPKHLHLALSALWGKNKFHEHRVHLTLQRN